MNKKWRESCLEGWLEVELLLDVKMAVSWIQMAVSWVLSGEKMVVVLSVMKGRKRVR